MAGGKGWFGSPVTSALAAPQPASARMILSSSEAQEGRAMQEKAERGWAGREPGFIQPSAL